MSADSDILIELSKLSITKLARRAGVKSLSDDCFNTIRSLIGLKLNTIISSVIIINDNHNVKTIMPSDIYKTLEILGYNITESKNLNANKKNM